MPTVRLDLIENSNGRYTKEGWEFTRGVIVEGLSGSAAAKIVAAVDAVINNGNDIGTSYPSVDTALLVEMTPTAVTRTKVELTLLYQTEDTEDTEPSIEIGSSVTQVETNKDADGVVLFTEYTYPADYKGDDKYRGQTVKQGGLISKEIPVTTIQFSRVEEGSPGTKSKLYTGKVNSKKWTLDLACVKNQWLCREIVGTKIKGTTKYNVRYLFEFREDAWDTEIFFECPDQGKPPADLVDGTGRKDVKTYTEIDFNGLALSA